MNVCELITCKNSELPSPSRREKPQVPQKRVIYYQLTVHKFTHTFREFNEGLARALTAAFLINIRKRARDPRRSLREAHRPTKPTRY